MKVIENRKIWFIISLFIIVAGFISLIFRGLNYDIEFAGGTIIQIDMHQELENHDDLTSLVKDITGDTNPQIQEVSGNLGENHMQIKVKEITPDTITALYQAIAEKYGLDTAGKTDLLEQSSISPSRP